MPEESAKVNRFLLVLIIILAITCLVLAYTLKKASNEQKQYGQIINDLAGISNLIEESCLYSLDSEAFREGILTGAVSSMDDPYSVYLNKASYQSLNDSMSGSFFGLGIVITLDRETKYPQIISVYEDSPAQRGGLKANDLIIEVEGEDVCNQDLDVIVSKIKGKAGTEVDLKFYREGEPDYLETTCTREKIEIINVEGERLDGNLAYVHLLQFDEDSGNEVDGMLKELQQSGSLSGIILDLRNNNGGSFAAALDVASLFIPEGPVVYVEDKDGNQQVFKTTRKSWNLPTVVLTNGYSASSSDIVSGA
ncbi:MAG: S41 family peptidase, partial [Clostridia bacterium]|nr:S41 family peptidase [Clostridia bacterium]